MYDFVGVLSDLFQQPLIHFAFYIIGLCLVWRICFQLVRIMCGIDYRRRPPKDIETPARVSREILIAESPAIIEGCADCPLCKSSGLRDEQCKLHGTAFCCVGRKLTDKGGVLYE